MKPFEILQNYTDWNALIDHCDSIEKFTHLEREKAKRAFKLLRKEFGDSFLKNALKARHPIFEHLLNMAPWTRKWIIWFADAIKELKDQENYNCLLKRLRDAAKFPEALSVLEIAYALCRAGFAIYIDPPVDTSGRTKIPDLRARDPDNDEEFFVEVSIQRQSEVEKEAWHTFQRIRNVLWSSVPFIHYCGRVHKTLSERHLDQVLKKVKKALDAYKTHETFQEVIIEGILELGIASESDKEILQKWAVERGFKVGEFFGPSFDVDEVLRTKRKIRNEQRQLPANYPNIVVVRNSKLFMHAKEVKAIIGELEEEVYRHPHLLAAVVWGGYMGKAENTAVMKDQHAFITKSRANLLVDQYIILLNKFCEKRVFPATITKLYNAFGSC